MKKILILLLSLLIFSYSFSWVKEYKKDEFGDATNEYQFVQDFKGGQMIIYYDVPTVSKNCKFILYKKSYKNGDYKLKFKSTSYFGDEKTTEVNAVVKEREIYVVDFEAFKVIDAFKISDIVKFSFEREGFQIHQENFNAIFNDFSDINIIN